VRRTITPEAGAAIATTEHRPGRQGCTANGTRVPLVTATTNGGLVAAAIGEFAGKDFASETATQRQSEIVHANGLATKTTQARSWHLNTNS
jgi:hypothetical protein